MPPTGAGDAKLCHVAKPVGVMAVAILSVMGAACDDGDTATTDDAMVRADEVCAAAHRELEDIATGATEDGAVTALNGTLDVLEQALADLRAIGYPAEEAGELDGVFAEIADSLIRARSAISRADATDAVDVAEDAYPAARFTDQLYELGFPANCANLF
jgi:phage gp29-like protein